MSERRFTVEQADAELADLRVRLPRLRRARRDLVAASRRVSDLVAADGGGVSEPSWFAAQQTLKDDLGSISERGILLRDPETGLVDFPAERDGERVYLCWRLGEERVGFFHTERGGMSGRRPL